MRAFLLLLALVTSGCAGSWVCDATTCGDGCCTGDGKCIVNGTDSYCGKAGGQCADCTTGNNLSCQSGSCQPKCNATTCANGCCDAYGTCRTTQYEFQCGLKGVACVDCAGSFAECRAGACCIGRYGKCTSGSACCSGSCASTSYGGSECQ